MKIMNEYLETLSNKIRYKKEYIENDTYRLFIKKNELEFLEKELQRLETLENVKSNKALEHFKHFEKWYRKLSYNVVTTYQLDKDLETIKQTLFKSQEMEKENARYKQLEEQIGCPLEVRCKVVSDSHIYDENGIEYDVVYIHKEYFDCEDPLDNDIGYTKLCAFEWKDYKKTWWLKADRSE